MATRQFSHGNDGVVGGGQLANDFVKLPALLLAARPPPDAPRHGDATIEEVMHWYPRTSQVWGPVHEVPTRQASVRLSEGIVDAAGVPVARLEGAQHPEDMRTAELLAARAEEWLHEAGAQRTWRLQPTEPALSGGQHQAGTARMSETPADGATDRRPGLGNRPFHVVDSSVHVTNGGANPVLTIMALAWRTAAHIAGRG